MVLVDYTHLYFEFIFFSSDILCTLKIMGLASLSIWENAMNKISLKCLESPPSVLDS